MSDRRSDIQPLRSRLGKKIAVSRTRRLWALALLAATLAFPKIASAQEDSSFPAAEPDYWKRLSFGFAESVAAHEAGHVIMALAVGAHPSFGFDKGRPTIFSGIDSRKYPHKQFLFSAAGLMTQDLINELILDVPHHGGGAMERGILAGGIATTLFYVTVGRNGSVSDIAFMSRTSSLSRTQISLIFGGVSALQAWRVSHQSRYSHFFFRPYAAGVGAGYWY